MSLITILHSLIGTVVVCSGGTALLSHKGSSLHRLSGLAFIASMLMMGLIVAAGAKLESGSISPLGVLFVVLMLYLATTAWTTIRKPAQQLHPCDYVAPVIALCIFISGVIWGIHADDGLGTQGNSPPKEAYFFFAALALMAMALDVNHLRSGGVGGKHRYIRHIWRMSTVLFFATSTLFTGPGSVVFPESLRGSSALAIPQYLVVILALIGFYRIWFRQWRPHSKNRITHLRPQDPVASQTTRTP